MKTEGQEVKSAQINLQLRNRHRNLWKRNRTRVTIVKGEVGFKVSMNQEEMKVRSSVAVKTY